MPIWILITALLSALAYALGRKHERAVKPCGINACANPAAHGKSFCAPCQTAIYAACWQANAYYGGQFPREPVTEIDAVSAYPGTGGGKSDTTALLIARPDDDTRITSEVSDGLSGLGWAKHSTREPIKAAFATLRQSGAVPETATVLREVLRSAGKRKGAR